MNFKNKKENMNSKNYIRNITNGFCQVVRQLYIDKKMNDEIKPLSEKSQSGILKDVANFDDKMSNISDIVADVFASYLKGGEIYLDFNDMYDNFYNNNCDNSLAMDIYSTLLEVNIDITDLLEGGYNLEMIGNQYRTEIVVSWGAKLVNTKIIANKSLTADESYESMEK